MKGKGRLLAAIAIIIGNGIGVGPSTLPFIVGPAGFVPALLMSTFILLFLTVTGILYVEAFQGTEPGTHYFTLARRFLGPISSIALALCFLLLYNTFMISYTAVASPMFSEMATDFLGITLPPTFFGVLMLILAGFVCYLGVSSMARVNLVLVLGLIISVIFFASGGSHHLVKGNLEHANWFMGFMTVPLFYSAYSYQDVLPTLVYYLKQNFKRVRLAVIYGSLLTYLITTLLMAVIIHTFSKGLLWQIFSHDNRIEHAFHILHTIGWSGNAAAFFATFAIVTSYLTVGFSLVDFYADGLKVKLADRRGLKRLYLILLAFLPPIFMATFAPNVINLLFNYIGGIIESLANCIFPVWMVWVARYQLKLGHPHLVPGGRPLLIGLLFCLLFIIYLQGIASVI